MKIRRPRFSSTVVKIEIHLRAHGRTEADAETLLDDLSLKIEEDLGNSAFSFRGETMEEVVGRRLAMTEFTLAVAESCTGGLIAQRLTSVPGSSKYFHRRGRDVFERIEGATAGRGQETNQRVWCRQPAGGA